MSQLISTNNTKRSAKIYLGRLHRKLYLVGKTLWKHAAFLLQKGILRDAFMALKFYSEGIKDNDKNFTKGKNDHSC